MWVVLKVGRVRTELQQSVKQGLMVQFQPSATSGRQSSSSQAGARWCLPVGLSPKMPSSEVAGQRYNTQHPAGFVYLGVVQGAESLGLSGFKLDPSFVVSNKCM